MSDEMLVTLDDAFARTDQKLTPREALGIRAPREAIDEQDADTPASEDATPRARSLRDRIPWVELFLAAQFLWGVAMFIPGAQQYRGYVRALPYIASLGLLVLYVPLSFRGSRPRGLALLLGSLALLVLNLLQPTTPWSAGMAQCVFQLSIAAPMFWAYKSVRSTERLNRVLVLVFLMNFASAGLGVLQVYFPDQFMPPQFNLNLADDYLSTLTYIGSGGRLVVRPPGLTDQPGGAALAGALTVLLGLGLSLDVKSEFRRVGLLGAAAIGLAVIYLTQVRSALLMVIGGVALLSVIAFRQRRIAAGAWISVSGGALVVAAFLWASSVGGASVEERFLNIRNQGVLETYQENRGHYITNTLGELLDQYPLGAGVGRWGMMSTYFGDPSDYRSPPFYVEPQITGWLLDGGVPMWLLYGGAILFSVLAGWRMTRSLDIEVTKLALIVVPVQVFVAGLGMAGPIFNTQMGIVFWMMASMLHGAASGNRAAVQPPATFAERSSRNSEAEDAPAEPA
jgi:hypothetical protein